MTDLPTTETPLLPAQEYDAAPAPEPYAFAAPEVRGVRGNELSIPPLRARHVYLRSDHPQRLPVPADARDRRAISRRVGAIAAGRHSPEQWVGTLWSDVLAQFMVVTTNTNKPIGRVLVYHPNFQDRNAYFAAMRFDLGDRSPLMMYGIALFLRYVFTNWESREALHGGARVQLRAVRQRHPTFLRDRGTIARAPANRSSHLGPADPGHLP